MTAATMLESDDWKPGFASMCTLSTGSDGFGGIITNSVVFIVTFVFIQLGRLSTNDDDNEDKLSLYTSLVKF